MGNTDKDEYGHGSHSRDAAAGGIGKYLDSADANYFAKYSGIAPNAKILNVRVLNDEGVGSSAI